MVSTTLDLLNAAAEPFGFYFQPAQERPHFIRIPLNEPIMYADYPRIPLSQALKAVADGTLEQLVLNPTLWPVKCNHCGSVTDYEAK